MIPGTVHHVFPYHVRHFADDVSGWWDVQLGSWPAAAALQGSYRAATRVHVISDQRDNHDQLIVHQGTHAGPEIVPYGFDLSVSLLRAMHSLSSSDVCFIHGASRPADILCAESARSAHVVGVYHGGAAGGSDRLKDLAERHVVLRSEVTQSLTTLGYDHSIIVELTPSVASGFFDTPRNSHVGRRVTVGFLGRPVYSKGADSIGPTLRALGVAGHEVLLEIVGALDVDEIGWLREEVLAAGSEFRSLGFIPNADIPQVIARWDVLFFPSRSEGCPRSVLEAMACGIPVVGVTGVIPDKLVHGQLVRVVDRADLPSAVVAALSGRAGRWATTARPAHRHVQGAADLDDIVEGLPAQPPKRGSAPMSTLRALASIATHAEPFRQRVRRVAYLNRRVMGRD